MDTEPYRRTLSIPEEDAEPVWLALVTIAVERAMGDPSQSALLSRLAAAIHQGTRIGGQHAQRTD